MQYTHTYNTYNINLCAVNVCSETYTFHTPSRYLSLPPSLSLSLSLVYMYLFLSVSFSPPVSFCLYTSLPPSSTPLPPSVPTAPSLPSPCFPPPLAHTYFCYCLRLRAGKTKSKERNQKVFLELAVLEAGRLSLFKRAVFLPAPKAGRFKLFFDSVFKRADFLPAPKAGRLELFYCLSLWATV